MSADNTVRLKQLFCNISGKLFSAILISFTITFFSCSDSPVNNVVPPISDTYKEAGSVTNGSYTAKIFFKNADSLTTGYNEVFFKVKNGANELNSGYVKLFPRMWMTPTYPHSTATIEKFDYDNSIGYYKGYVIFNMPTTPPELIWWGFTTFFEPGAAALNFDSVGLYTAYRREKQWNFFYDSTDQKIYMLSIVSPLSAVRGMNNISIMLHKTDASLNRFEEIDNAEMFLKVYDVNTNNPSTGNESPVPGGNGIYNGKINLPYAGEWIVCDTIKYMNRFITNSPPPMPEFYFNLP